MFDLYNFFDKDVIIETDIGKIRKGLVINYSSALQNVEEAEDREMDSIDLRCGEDIIQLYADEIISIRETETS